MSNKFHLPQTEHYYVDIGPEAEGDRLVYRIVNKVTGVFEFETPMFPQLLTVLEQFESAIGTYNFKEESPSNVVQFPVTKH